MRKSMCKFLFKSATRHWVRGTVYAAVMSLALQGPAFADQRDPALPDLFDRLQAAEDFDSAHNTATAIWEIWSTHNEPEISEQLTLGTRFMETGRLRAAEAIFSQIIAQDPQFAEAWNKRATTFFMMGRFNASKQDVAQTLKLEPRHFGALAGLGLIEMHLGNYEPALKAYQAAKDIHPHMRDIDRIAKSLEEMMRGQPL